MCIVSINVNDYFGIFTKTNLLKEAKRRLRSYEAGIFDREIQLRCISGTVRSALQSRQETGLQKLKGTGLFKREDWCIINSKDSKSTEKREGHE